MADRRQADCHRRTTVMSDFEEDKTQLFAELTESRAGLLAIVESLSSGDFQQARRGSWTVARILEHVLHSERLYTQLVSAFTGKSATLPDAREAAEADAAISALNSSRAAFLSAISDVDEDDFYRLQTIGHEEYSVLSILENNAAHDREHAAQISKTLES